MKFVVESMTPGMMVLPSGTRTVSNTRHSCACRGLAPSKETAVAASGQHEVDDVRQRHVEVVRPLVVAPAHVHADLLGRDIGEGMIQRLDVEPGHGAERRDVEVGELDVPAHAEVGAVDLQHEARARDRLVLVLHRLRDGVEIGLVGGIVLVLEEERDHPRRGGGEEGFARPRSGRRRPRLAASARAGLGIAQRRPARCRRGSSGGPGRGPRRPGGPCRGSPPGRGTGAARTCP